MGQSPYGPSAADISHVCSQTAKADTVIIGLLDGYFKEQFLVNGSEDSLEFWQVFDRTDNAEVPREQWTFDEAQGTVTVAGIRAYHDYTVNSWHIGSGKRSICIIMLQITGIKSI